MERMRTSTRLRKMLESGDFLINIQVATAHQAQLAEKVGFKVVGISGANVSAVLLGLPDVGFLTMTEVVQNVERICRAVNIPVIVDCDTGFGNAINVRRTVDSVIQAGAAALFIEDQVAPKRCGFAKGKELISLEEAVGKYRAALDVRDELDPDFIIMARTDARGAVGGGLAEVIRRGKAYLEAGVDILYCEALRSREEIRQVRNALKDCLLTVTTQEIEPPLSQNEIQELGLCLPAVHISHIASIATYDFLLELKDRGLEAYLQFRRKIQDHPLGGPGTSGPLVGLLDLVGFPRIFEWEKKYLSPEKMSKYERSLGSYDPHLGNRQSTSVKRK